MGKERNCTVRYQGKSSSGQALLETNEILFRGDFRLKIPLSSLKSVVAHDGELHLKWPQGSATLALGAYSAKWAQKILHPKSTADKLGIKPGLVVSCVAMPDDGFATDLRRNAESFSNAKPLKDSDLIFFGANKGGQLERVRKLAIALASKGALWIVYPKGKQEIREIDVLTAGRDAGLVDVKVVSFSATHTALKFMRPKSKR
jgi:hypothetical protein